MKLKCKNPKCLYEWNYHGKHKFYATCPRCLNKVSLKNGRIQDDEKTQKKL